MARFASPSALAPRMADAARSCSLLRASRNDDDDDDIKDEVKDEEEGEDEDEDNEAGNKDEDEARGEYREVSPSAVSSSRAPFSALLVRRSKRPLAGGSGGGGRCWCCCWRWCC